MYYNAVSGGSTLWSSCLSANNVLMTMMGSKFISAQLNSSGGMCVNGDMPRDTGWGAREDQVTTTETSLSG